MVGMNTEASDLAGTSVLAVTKIGHTDHIDHSSRQQQTAPKMRRFCAVLPWKLGRVFVGVLLAAVIFSAFLGRVLASDVASPDNDVELVCHTDNPADCYPKVFQPTKDFQKLHDDQDVPPGLHVRLNVWTGEKEAKLNDPDEGDAAVAGLTTDRAVVVVNPDAAAGPSPLPSGAPLYEPAGLVKPPGDASPAFQNALAVLKKGVPQPHLFSFGRANASRFDQALDDLNEFAHDIYYGVKIAEDEGALLALLCHMSPGNVSDVGTDEAPVMARAQQAAAIVAAALQNNPTALRSVDKSWESLTTSPCSGKRGDAFLGERVFGSFTAREGVRLDTAPALAKARLSAINGLLKSNVVKKDFLSRDGMGHVLELLLSSQPEHEAAQRRAANLVMDNFLDEAMGATTSLWPHEKPRTGSGCLVSKSPVVSEDCWDAHMERLAGEHEGDESHWSVVLWALLKERRVAEGGTVGGKDEL